MIPNHLLWPPEPAVADYDLNSMADDEAGRQARYSNAASATAVARSFRTMFGPAADAEKTAFRDMLKVIHRGRGQDVPTLPVAEPIDTTDVDLPRIVIGGASSGNACDKPPAAAEVARHDTVAPASGSGSGGAASGGESADSAALRGIAGDLGPASNRIATAEMFARGNVGAGLGGVIGSALPATIQNLAAPNQADTVAQPGVLPGSDIGAILAGMRQAAVEPDTGIQLAQAGNSGSNAPPSLLPADTGSGDVPDPNGVVPGGPWTLATGQRESAFYGPPQKGGRALTQWVPRYGKGGPIGSVGYWKTKAPTTPWVRFDQSGHPITPEQAHPNPPTAPRDFAPAIPETPAIPEVPEMPELPVIPP